MKSNPFSGMAVFLITLAALASHRGIAMEKKLYRVFLLTNKSSPTAKLIDKSLVFTEKLKLERWRREKAKVGDIKLVGEPQKLFYFETEKKAGVQKKALLERGFATAEEAKEWVKSEIARAEEEKEPKAARAAASEKQLLPGAGTSFTLIHAGTTSEYELHIAEMPNVQIMDEGEVVEAKQKVDLKFNHSVHLTPMK